MGYYTNFRVSSVLPSDEYQEKLEEISGYEFAEDGQDLYLSYSKWYDDIEHMKKLSLLFPGILFEVEGEGEEAGDWWKEYFKDGKMQRCQAIVTFEPYDEGKLK